MRILTSCFFFVLVGLALHGCKSNEGPAATQVTDTTSYHEKYRPQFHFSPPKNWMNDPNGLVHFDNEYHLFYQYHPDSSVWGPMHWGHAVSSDLMNWKNLPIALYPDSLGLIFSGSAVADTSNTSGFGSKENPPVVAIFTYHSVEKADAGRTDFQNQGIAFSTDKGRTWTKYEGNPVLKNQGVADFRDPKVFWNEKLKQWTMILAVKDHVELWSSPNLKAWKKLSEFGQDFGAHGGVWECPDLFELPVEGEHEKKWVMLVSINPGGPNGGSATQYFTGDFDGKKFTPDSDKASVRWIDYGPDNYAGVTYSNIPQGRKIFLGWMSNWDYGQEVPTSPWRSAMTSPRDLILKRIEGKLYVKSTFSPEVLGIASSNNPYGTIIVQDSLNLTEYGINEIGQSIFGALVEARDFSIELSNQAHEKLVIAYDHDARKYTIDRSQAGRTGFSKKYSLKPQAPRISKADVIPLIMVVDRSSVEVMFDEGVTAMTSVFFTEEPLSAITIKTKGQLKIEGVMLAKLKSVWP